MSPAVVHRRRMGAARPVVIGALSVLALGSWLGPVQAAMVQISVTGVRDGRGHVRVDVCTRDTFLKGDCPYSGEAVATPGATLVTVPDVPPGEYAVQAFHDTSDRGVVHQNFLGIPEEPVGFSNNAPLRLKGPRFGDAAFMVGHDVARITLKLRRVLGAFR